MNRNRNRALVAATLSVVVALGATGCRFGKSGTGGTGDANYDCLLTQPTAGLPTASRNVKNDKIIEAYVNVRCTIPPNTFTITVWIEKESGDEFFQRGQVQTYTNNPEATATQYRVTLVGCVTGYYIVMAHIKGTSPSDIPFDVSTKKKDALVKYIDCSKV